MKKLLLLFITLLTVVSGAWAESSTWESKEGWTATSGGVANLKWFGVHTPGDASTTYSFTSIQLMQNSGSDNTNYLAIARVGSTSTLNADQVVAVSDNAIQASTEDNLETYKFSAGVTLLGGTTYYLVFVTSNTPTNGTYTIQEGRVRLNHNGYTENYPYGDSNSASHTWWPYFKATVESAPATGFCTGDILGGSMESGNWKDTWTSGTTSSFTLTSSANNINNADTKPAGGLDIRSGSAKTATYTITAPAGYAISGYKLFGKALNGNQTVTPAEGGNAVVFTSAGNSISVTGDRKASKSFTLAGENNGLFLHAMEVTLTPLTFITTLPTENNKAYVVTNARGTWNFADAATSMTAVATANTNLDAQAQQIALVYKNENYYLFSVNAGKYLTAENTLTSMPTDAEQVSIISTENATYPWFFKFKNVADKNFNVNSNPTLVIDNYSTIDEGNSNAIVEAVDFDVTEALQMFDVRNVTYNLSYGGNPTFRTESNVAVTLSGDAADFVPASFLNDFVTLSYSPETITGETTEVTVTATWNGPFQISDDFASAKWQVVHMHTYIYGGTNYLAEKWAWTYKSDDGDKVKPEQAQDYSAVTTNRLFSFVGNPYDGFKIYNAAKGNACTLARAGEDDELTMAAGENLFTLHKSIANTDVTTYFCLKPNGATNYLNFDYTNRKIAGWVNADNGSTCWAVAPGQYYLDFIDGLYLDAPVGAVGTNNYFVSHPEALGTITSLRSTVASNMYSMELSSVNGQLYPIKNSETITLADGYYRLVNAYASWRSTAPTVYYNSANDRMDWSVASNAKGNVNSIVKINATTPSIYSPNAQQYMSLVNSDVSGELADEPGTTVFTYLGSAQYNIVVGGGTMHTAGHNSGAGTGSNLTSWSGSANTASAWYIVEVKDVDITLNDGGDGNYYATMYLPFDVTLSGTDAYTLAVSGDYVVPTPLTGNKVPAGTGVLLRGTNATATATINTGEAFSTSNQNDLAGTYVARSLASGDFVLGKGDNGVGFYLLAEGNSLAANRAYLEASKVGNASVKGFVLNWGDVDAIGSVAADAQVQHPIYNLAGQRVQKVQKGLYIVNGKKVVLK